MAVVLGLVLAALLLRGGLGVLLGILTLLVVMDTLVPVPGRASAEADERFSHLVRERDHDRRHRARHHLPPQRLGVLDDRRGWAARADRRRLGVEVIPLASITGTVEEAKAAAFDRSFRPEPAARERWKRLWMAHARGSALPPVSVYRVGSEHLVRDGHHRISVALDHGASVIDADVVELHRPAAGEPDGADRRE